MVPRLRTCGSPIWPATSASAGIAAATSDEFATASWTVIAPTVTAPPDTWMPLSSATAARSTTSEGCARRCFRVGSRVMPPAISTASSPPATLAAASATEPAA